MLIFDSAFDLVPGSARSRATFDSEMADHGHEAVSNVVF